MAKPPNKPVCNVSPDLKPSHAIVLLRKQQEEGERLAALGVISQEEFACWKTTTREFIARAFGSDTPNLRSFEQSIAVSFAQMQADKTYHGRMRMTQLAHKMAIVKSCIEQLSRSAKGF